MHMFNFRPAISSLTLVLIIFISSVSDAIQDDTIIRVNDRKIGAREFTNRLNGLPQTLKLSENEIKESFACTLLAETILSLEAFQSGLDTLERVRSISQQYSDEATYEEWMNTEVRNRITVSERELLAAYNRFREQRVVMFSPSPTMKEALEFRKRILEGGMPGETLETKEITYGESLESVEDVIYKLKVNEVSNPVLLDGSYYVFQLLKSLPHPQYSKNSFDFWRTSVERNVRTRKEMSAVDRKLDALMEGKAFNVDKRSYEFVLGQLYPVIYDKEKLRFELPEFIQQEIVSKEIHANGPFGQPLITFKGGGEWTVGDFWKRLSVCPYPLNYKNPEELKKGLFDVIKRIVLFEAIVRDGKNKGYDTSAYVKDQASMWRHNVLAQAQLHEYRKSVSVDEGDLIRYYDATKLDNLKPEQRRIVPIIVRDKQLVESIQKDLVAGGDFISLAERHSINKSGVNRADPGVFITRETWGNIGKTAFEMNTGQVSDIIKLADSAYAFVQLVEIKPAAPYAYEEIRARLLATLEDRELQHRAEGILLRSVKKYDLAIDRDALKRIRYLGGTMGVKKTHFPLRGAVPGFPLFNPKAKWYRVAIGAK